MLTRPVNFGIGDKSDPNAVIDGRTQFMPEIAVDQTTGTVVLSWRDARNDPANALVATYLTSSIDGGNTFSAQTYANPAETAVDAITGQTDVLGPEADNQSASNSQRDLAFGYGVQMGLAVDAGQVYPVWAGNFNEANLSTGTPIGNPLNIWYTPMVIAAGPRIVSSTMGPVVTTALSASAVDLPQYIPPVNTSNPTISTLAMTGDPNLNVTSLEVTLSLVYPTDGNLTITLISPPNQAGVSTSVILYHKLADTGQSFTDTTFSDSATESITNASAPYTGTFIPFQSLSAFNGLQAFGNWQLRVSGGIGPQGGILQSWSLAINGAASKPTSIEVTFDRPIDPQALLNLGEGTFNPDDVQVFYHNTTNGTASIPLLVTGVVPVQPDPTDINDPNQNGTYGYTKFLIYFNPDEQPNATASGITDYTGTYSYMVLPDNGSGAPISSPIASFVEAPVPQPVINSALAPNLPISTWGPGGSGNPNFDQTTSTINLANYNNQVISELTVNLDITDPLSNGLGDDGDLAIYLTAPNGATTTLYYKPGDTSQSFTNVTFSDEAAQSIQLVNGPYTNGTYQPVSPLAGLNGGAVDGAYTLTIDNYSYINSGTLVSWSIAVNSTKLALQFQTGAAMDQNADGTVDENPLLKPFTGLTPGDAYVVPTPQPSAPFTFNATNVLNPPFNQNTLPVIMPGPYVVSTSVPNGSGADNLVLNGTDSSLNVTFDQPMQTSTFTPGQVLQITGPDGSVSGPQNFASTSGTGQMIPPATSSTSPGTLSSTLSVPSYDGTFTVAHITVELSAAFSPDSDLTAVLIAPDGTMVTLFSGVGGTGSNFVNTIFDDSAVNSITTGTAPFTGSYKPSSPLSTLDGLTVDMANPLDPAMIVAGTWTLKLINSGTGASGTLDNWSLNITPVISVTPVNPVSGTATTFQIGFPLQQQSGTYTIQLGPDILDTFGDELDTNLNAGLSVLRDQDQNGPTTTTRYSAPSLFTTIPAATVNSSGQNVPATASSNIAVPDSFVIKGDQTAAGLSVMQVELDVSFASDSNLTATLTHYDSSGDNLGSVTLFSGVGSGPNSANFTDTVFDDNANTPIQNGSAPFFANYNPQESLATVFAPSSNGQQGMNVQGIWTLTITNTATGTTGTINGWSLIFQRLIPTSGLGEAGSDDGSASFRIFTLSPSDPESSALWTSVGAASSTDEAGQVNAIAVDPSDPSGNTVYAGGASGGIWMTTDFLTTSPGGPTWVPLTNFGPTSAVDISSITVFPMNGNPNQSIIIAATGGDSSGEQATDAPGVGFLISTDGGATWNLDDSTDNVSTVNNTISELDDTSNILPIDSPDRDREFVGTTSYQVTVDPELTPNGQVIIYAALSGSHGGIWMSDTTGQTWTRVLSGNATAVVLDPNSGLPLDPNSGNTPGNPTDAGNYQIVYAGIEGQGVFISTNQGQSWTLMAGGIGNPQIVDETNGDANVNALNNPSPNGGGGKIVLAVPAATNNYAQSELYAGWLYAAVATGTSFDGLFITKDFGANWTKIQLDSVDAPDGYKEAVPTNDTTQAQYPITIDPTGIADLALTVDPQNPNITYLGGFGGDLNGSDTGLIRVDATNLYDADSLVGVLYNQPQENLTLETTAWTTIDAGDYGIIPAWINPQTEFPQPADYLNFLRNPDEPFLQNSTLFVENVNAFTNTGAGATWTPMDVPTTSNFIPPGSNDEFSGTGYQVLVTEVDPATGLTRLVAGSLTGIYSGLVSDAGTFVTTIGTSTTTPAINRNGNLDLAQFYYGAVQPSTAAALVAGAMFYGGAQNIGGQASDPNLLTNGNLQWSALGGDTFLQPTIATYTPANEVDPAGGIFTITSGTAVDQQGVGTLYQYWSPGQVGGADTGFVRVDGIERTYGLLQASGGLPTPDPQWDIISYANIVVDPVSGDDELVSSSTGNIFETSNQGETWFDIGQPSTFGSPDNTSFALAFGAPDPTAPEGIGNLGNFVYVGTSTGKIYVSQVAGGNWSNISAGLDGSAVEQIITDPARSSHDAYAVTADGVYYIANSVPSASNPTPTWVNITGDLKTLAYSIFGQSYNPANDTQPYDLAVTLSSIAADWRYAIPFDPSDLAKGYHPVLYVGADSGVFQSLDNGQTWNFFPNTTYGAAAQGGDLPHVPVSSLSLSVGDVDVDTGMAALDGPYAPDPSNQTSAAAADPDVLMAATYGEGEFAINVAPLIVGNTLNVDGTIPGSTPGSLPVVNGPITIGGTSEISGFGNATWITVEDVTNPADPVIVAGFNPADPVPTPSSSNSTDSFGNFAIPFNPVTYYPTNGIKTIEVWATDDAGAVGNVVTYSFNLDPATKLVFVPANEPPAMGIAGQNFASPTAVIVEAEAANGFIANNFTGTVTISLANNAMGIDQNSTLTATAVDGYSMFTNLAIDSSGTYQLSATSTGLTSGTSTSIVINPNVPDLLVWAPQPPTQVTAGATFDAALDVEDKFGNPEKAYTQNVSVSLDLNAQAANGDLDPMSTITIPAVGGVANFNDLIIDKSGQPFTLIGSTGALTSAPSNAIDVIAGPEVGLYILPADEPPPTVVAGADFGFIVEADDKYGNPTSLTGSVTVAIANNPGGSTLGGTLTATASGGVATFSDLTLNKVGTDYTLQVTSKSLNSTTTTTGINVIPAPATQLVIMPPGEPPASVLAGQSFPVVVDAEDPFGNVDTNFTGSVAIPAPSTASGATGFGSFNAVAGVANFPNLAITKSGTYQLTAASTGLSSVTSTSVTVNPLPVATQLGWFIEPPAQIGHTLGFKAELAVEDFYANPETAFDGTVSIAFDSNPTGAVLGASSPVSAVNGVATFPALTINKIGNGYTLVATGDGLTSPDSTPINVTPIPPSAISVTTQPLATVQVTQTFGLTVTISDQAGVPDPDFNGPVTVTMAGSPANTLTGNLTVNASGGVANFSGLSLADVGAVTLEVSAPTSNLSPITSDAINVVAGRAMQLILVTEPPGSLTAGNTFGFEVEAEDKFGNVATGFNGILNAALSTNAAGATLNGGVSSANAGVDLFTGLSVDTAGSGYTIVVSNAGSPSLSVTTSTFSVSPGAASQLIIPTEPPANVAVYRPFSITVAIADPYGNVVTSSSGGLVAIGLATAPNSGQLNGTLTATLTNGVASFPGLSLSAVASGYTIEATNGGFTVTSTSINVTPFTPTKLEVFVQPPPTMVAGADFGLGIVAEDAYGNIATQFTGNVTIALDNDPTGAMLIGSGPYTVAANAGVANFLANNMTLDVVGSGYTIQATSPGLSSVISGTINVTPAAATHLVVVTEPPALLAGGQTFGFVVAAEDPYGNIDTNFNGQVSVAPPSGTGVTLTGNTTVLASKGVATFSGLVLSQTSSPVSLLVSSSGLTGTTTTAVGATVTGGSGVGGGNGVSGGSGTGGSGTGGSGPAAAGPAAAGPAAAEQAAAGPAVRPPLPWSRWKASRWSRTSGARSSRSSSFSAAV